MTTKQMQARAQADRASRRPLRYGQGKGTNPKPPRLKRPRDEKPTVGKFEAGRIVRARLNVEAAIAQQRRRAPTYGQPTARQAPRRKP